MNIMNVTFETNANLTDVDLTGIAGEIEYTFKDTMCNAIFKGAEPNIDGKEWQKTFYQVIDWMKENYTFTKY